MTEKPWYREFFGQGYLDSLRQNPERTLQEVSFIETTLALPVGSSLLDLCCGHGRHLIELAARGYHMTGLDLDPLFLQIARDEAEKRGVQVRLEDRDMRDIPFANEFDGAYNVFTAFGYLESDGEDQKVLDAVARALKPGSPFLMELLDRDTLMRIYQRHDWYETDTGIKVLEQREFDFLAGRINARHTRIYPNGIQGEDQPSVRVYTLTELARMLQAAGLVVEATFGGLDGSPFNLESRRLAILARKS